MMTIMRDLVITQNSTVDGVIEATGDWFALTGEQVSADQVAALAAQRDASDGFLTGRLTFEAMRDYWAPKTDDTTGVTAHLNRVAKYVVSSTLIDPGWDNTEVISGPLPEAVAEIKQRPGGDIVCTGSITLCRALIAADLVDEFRLFTFAYVRGHGERLFQGSPAMSLEVVESTAFESGAVLTRYRRRR
jgi:dihydrofolate reductase